MDNNIRKIRNILLTVFMSFISATIIIIVLHETDIVLNGALTGNKNSEFIVLTIMELLTIALIPISLKLLKTKYVRKDISNSPGKNMLNWSMLRLCLIGIPMIANLLLYYSYMSVAFGYMAIIGLLCMFFIYPSMDKCTNENTEDK